jgi:DnaJ-class molecular chaperone
MKLKITNGVNYTEQAKADKCTACAGSGFYDFWDTRRNKPIICGNCDGTGLEPKD